MINHVLTVYDYQITFKDYYNLHEPKRSKPYLLRLHVCGGILGTLLYGTFCAVHCPLHECAIYLYMCRIISAKGTAMWSWPT